MQLWDLKTTAKKRMPGKHCPYDLHVATDDGQFLTKMTIPNETIPSWMEMISGLQIFFEFFFIRKGEFWVFIFQFQWQRADKTDTRV